MKLYFLCYLENEEWIVCSFPFIMNKSRDKGFIIKSNWFQNKYLTSSPQKIKFKIIVYDKTDFGIKNELISKNIYKLLNEQPDCNLEMYDFSLEKTAITHFLEEETFYNVEHGRKIFETRIETRIEIQTQNNNSSTVGSTRPIKGLDFKIQQDMAFKEEIFLLFPTITFE